jgi:hypothetical protein
MQSNTAWSQWAESLRRYRLDGLVAWFLEAGAPLTVVGAQMIHLTQPFLGGNQAKAIAHMLEEEDETRRFAHYLHDERAS